MNDLGKYIMIVGSINNTLDIQGHEVEDGMGGDWSKIAL